jgi:hypothetical protein
MGDIFILTAYVITSHLIRFVRFGGYCVTASVRIPRMCGFDDPQCNLSVGLLLAGQQGRRCDSNDTVNNGADRRKVITDEWEVSRPNVLHGFAGIAKA